MPPSAPPTCLNMCTVRCTVLCTVYTCTASISRSLTVYYLTGCRAQTVVSSIQRGESGTAPTQTLPTGTQTLSDRQLCEVGLSVSQRGTNPAGTSHSLSEHSQWGPGVRMTAHSGSGLVLLASVVILSLGRAVRGEQRLENWFNPKLNITPPSPCGACGVTEIENFDKLSPFAEHRAVKGTGDFLRSWEVTDLICFYVYEHFALLISDHVWDIFLDWKKIYNLLLCV